MVLAMKGLRGALPSKCKSLKADIQNQCNIWRKLRPIDLSQATKVLQNCTVTKGALLPRKEGGIGASFYQADEAQVKGINGKLSTNVKCRNCGKTGNCQSYFPSHDQDREGEVEGTSHFQVDSLSRVIDSDSDTGM